MSAPLETAHHLLLAKLTLPVRKLMVRTAVECAGQVAKVLSLDTRETFAIKLAVDEAFCNAVEHFSGDIKEDEHIHIAFSVKAGSLVISIREKGIPFDSAQAERFTPGDLESVNRPGLGSLLMLNAMDSVELLSMDGKERKSA
ncbi:ATP-binding protein [uncultured Pseudodesulfovibrio sp.]|uniref:ATP-binding protein n=1 Tax=uncultured Pseudodesulfovibrio sp. TaxID=2035858 RepID=UPI0029C7C478|nr:ATP-binding protein [uncultured Pseudodesulfovibrio sp.]